MPNDSCPGYAARGDTASFEQRQLQGRVHDLTVETSQLREQVAGLREHIARLSCVVEYWDERLRFGDSDGQS